MAGNKITRKEVVEEKVLTIGQDYAKALQPAIEANEKWLKSFAPIKAAALEYVNLEKQFKVSQGQKEFLEVKKKQEQVTIKATNALRNEKTLSEQNIVAKQQQLNTEKQLITVIERKKLASESTVRALAREKLELQFLNKGVREAATLSSHLAGAYAKLVVKMDQAGRVVQNLTAKKLAGNKLSKQEEIQLKKSTAEFAKYNKAVLGADASIKRFQRNVGNYPKALNSAAAAARNLASALNLVGGAFLVVQVLRDALKIVRDFEKANATLSAILQVERSEMKGLTEDAVRLGESTVKTAGQVTELQIAYARLGFAQEDILNLTEATISGSIAMNSELDRTAELVGAVVNTFDDFSTIDAPEIIDIMALSTAKSALNFEKLATGLPIVGGAANAAGIPFTRLIALMGKLSDSGIDISSSSTALRNIFIESAAQGLNYEQILEKIKGSQDKLTASNDEFGKRAAVSAAVLANNIDKTNELDEALNNAAGTAERMANKELDTLDGAIKLLRSAWEGYILRLDESTESSLSLKNAIGFVAENLDKILNFIALSIKLWIAYKIAVQTARLQTFLMNQQLALTAINAVKGATGINIATVAWKRFTLALKANALFLIISAITGLVYVLDKMNKSIGEIAEKTNEATNEFIQQKKAADDLNTELTSMVSRYEELKSKTELNKKEQKELNDIIAKLIKNVPEATAEFDEYGRVIGINTGKVKEFIAANKDLLTQKNATELKENRELLQKLREEQERLNNVVEEGNTVEIKGVGTVIKRDGVIQRAIKSSGNYSAGLRIVNDLTTEELDIIGKTLEKNQERIIATEDNIAALGGEKTARQLAAEASEKQTEEAKKAADEKAKEVLIVQQLRKEIAQLEEDLVNLTKNGYENLTQAEADLILTTRENLANKKKELDAILGITKANKDAEKAAKERAAAEKKLRDDAFGLESFALNQQIEEQKAIAENEKEFFYLRQQALEDQASLELDLARITAQKKLQDIEGFKQAEIDALLASDQLTLEQTKKLTDEQLLIYSEFQAKKREIQSGKENSEDLLEVERIKKEAAAAAAIQETALNNELDAENKAFIAKEGIYENQLKAVENYEKRIAEIKEKYALEALAVQIKALEDLVEQTALGSNERIEAERKLAEAKAKYSEISVKSVSDNIEKEIELNKERFDKIVELSQELASTLIDIAGNIFNARIQNIDDEIQRNDERYDRLLENEQLSEENRTAIEAERDRKRDELEKKRRQEERKAAIVQKAFNVATIIGNIAVAISKVAAQTGILAPAAVIPIAALGALQLASALSVKIPSYAKGTKDKPKDGPALVGEGKKNGKYVAEVIEEPGKAPYIVDRPTIIDLPRHTKVTPSLEEYQRLMRASMLTSVHFDNKKITDFQSRQVFNFNDKLIAEKLDNVERAVKRQKSTIHVHERELDFDAAMKRYNKFNWHN